MEIGTYQFFGKEWLLITQRHEECETGATQEVYSFQLGVPREGGRWMEPTPVLRRSDLVPHAGIVRRLAPVVAGAKDRETRDGMVYLGTDGDTETQKQ